MKEETKQWLKYAEENLEAAKILSESHLYNTALHNVQQSVEKAIKPIFIEKGIKLKKSHSITELNSILEENDIELELSDEDIDLLDSIYLPSKYPLGSVLPDYFPDEKITQRCISMAEKAIQSIKIVVNK